MFRFSSDCPQACLFDVELPEEDLKNMETSRSVSGFYVIVYF